MRYLKHLYIVGAEQVPTVKIGVALCVVDRLRSLNAGSPVRLSVFAQSPAPSREMEAVEWMWHARLSRYHSHAEWFNLPARVRQHVAAMVANGRLPKFHRASTEWDRHAKGKVCDGAPMFRDRRSQAMLCGLSLRCGHLPNNRRTT